MTSEQGLRYPHLYETKMRRRHDIAAGWESISKASQSLSLLSLSSKTVRKE